MTRLTLRPSEDCRFDLVALGEVMLRFDPGDGQNRDHPHLRRFRGRRRIQRRAGTPSVLRAAYGDRHRLRRQPHRPPARGSHSSGRSRPALRRLAAVRRHRARGSQRPQFRRAGLWRPGGSRLLGPWAVGRGGDEARRRRLGRCLRTRRCALVPLRRHLRCALREHRRRRARGHAGRAPPRHDRVVRPQLPAVALEGDRRHRGGCRSRIASSSSRSTSSSGTKRISRLHSATRSTVSTSRTPASTSSPTSGSTGRYSTATPIWRSSRPRSAKRTRRR